MLAQGKATTGVRITIWEPEPTSMTTRAHVSVEAEVIKARGDAGGIEVS